MQCYEIGDQTGLDSLTRTDRPDPVPGAGEAVVRIHAVCLNHRDLLVLEGAYGPKRPTTRVPVSDGVGTVVALGDGTAGPAVGRRVICAHFCSWIDGAFAPSIFASDLGITRDGWLAERIVVPTSALVEVPDTVDDEQAVALPAAGLTAWNALVEVGRVKAGDLVLVLGTGGVSMLALQIAKANGARVAVTSSSPAKLETARALGADYGIDYRAEPDWDRALLSQTGGRGADIVVETGGLATLGKSIAAAAPNGRIVLIGALASRDAPPPLTNLPSVIGKNLMIRGITEGNRRMLAELVRAVDANRLRPVIDRRFAFDEAPAAYAHLKSGDHLGKVMIRMSPTPVDR